MNKTLMCNLKVIKQCIPYFSITIRHASRVTEPLDHILSPIVSSTTVDLNEVKHHTSMCNQWWDIKGPMKGLHSMNQLRVPFIRDGLIETGMAKDEYINTATPLKDVKILEVGCGGGILTEPLAIIGGLVTGLDASIELVTMAQEHSQRNRIKNINYINSSIENYAEENVQQFDAVVVSEVLEHVSQKDVFLEFCLKTLKPGGSVFITTISKSYESWLLAVIAAENIFNLVPKGTHDWDKFIEPREVQRLLEINNCSTKKLHGMFYQFWSNSWMWATSNLDINFALQAVKQHKK